MLILARHGETQANADGLLLGRADPELTDAGRRQAAALAAMVGEPRLVVSSPLRRARETAAAFGVDVEVDGRWIELDYGDYDQMPIASVADDVWDKWRTDPAFRAPGGESLIDLGVRVRAAVTEIADEARGGDVVVVSHVSPIKAAVAWALGVGDEVAWRMFLDTCAVCRIAIGPRGPSLRSFNECHHVRAIASQP